MSNLSQVIYLTNARLSFPHIIEPQRQTGADGNERVSYNADLLVAPNDPNLARLMQVVNALAADKWKDKAPAVMAYIQQNRKFRAYAAGEEKVNGKTMLPYDGYAGMTVLTAGSSRQPQIIDARGAVIDAANTMACQAEARKMYGGSRVNVAIKPWLQENSYGRAVRFDFVAIQFAADDTPFGEGRVDVTGMFGATDGAAAGAPGTAAWAPPAQTTPGFATPAPVAPQAPPTWAPPATSAPSFLG